MSKKKPFDKTFSDYRSYILRIWHENDAVKAKNIWRASLKETASGKKTAFPNLEALFVHLRSQTIDADKEEL